MKLFTSFILLALVCGCTSTLTKADLDAKAAEQAGSTSPGQTYYVGSDFRYDYFVVRSGTAERTQLYKVRVSEGAVTNRFAVIEDDTRWRGYHTSGVVMTNSLPDDH